MKCLWNRGICSKYVDSIDIPDIRSFNFKVNVGCLKLSDSMQFQDFLFSNSRFTQMIIPPIQRTFHLGFWGAVDRGIGLVILSSLICLMWVPWCHGAMVPWMLIKLLHIQRVYFAHIALSVQCWIPSRDSCCETSPSSSELGVMGLDSKVALWPIADTSFSSDGMCQLWFALMFRSCSMVKIDESCIRPQRTEP